MEYPYLGFKQIQDKGYVVFFTKEDYGVVVMSDFEDEEIKVGDIGEFDEKVFTFLNPEMCVRLQNKNIDNQSNEN